MLEEADRRKAAGMKQAGGKFTLVVAIVAGSLALWAAVFLIRHESENPSEAPPEPTVAAPGQGIAPLTDEEKEMAQYDMFRPNGQRIVKTIEEAKESGRIIDKDDIHFAIELLNFMHRPADPKPAAR